MKTRRPGPQHHAFRNDALALLNKHAGHLDSSEMLALSAHLVGQIIAMQDQRTITPKMALEIVQQNIEAGNKEVLASMGAPRGNA